MTNLRFHTTLLEDREAARCPLKGTSKISRQSR